MLNMEPPAVPRKDKSDSYGSLLREELKRSMAEPAKPYKSLNKLEPKTVSPWVLLVFMLAVILLGVLAVHFFNWVEGLFR